MSNQPNEPAFSEPAPSAHAALSRHALLLQASAIYDGAMDLGLAFQAYLAAMLVKSLEESSGGRIESDFDDGPGPATVGRAGAGGAKPDATGSV